MTVAAEPVTAVAEGLKVVPLGVEMGLSVALFELILPEEITVEVPAGWSQCCQEGLSATVFGVSATLFGSRIPGGFAAEGLGGALVPDTVATETVAAEPVTVAAGGLNVLSLGSTVPASAAVPLTSRWLYTGEDARGAGVTSGVATSGTRRCWTGVSGSVLRLGARPA